MQKVTLNDLVMKFRQLHYKPLYYNTSKCEMLTIYKKVFRKICRRLKNNIL